MNRDNRRRDINEVSLAGEVVGAPVLDHKAYDDEFYVFPLKSVRKSNIPDIVQVMVPAKRFNISEIQPGNRYFIRGQFRSHNIDEDGKRRMVLYVLATSMRPEKDGTDSDHIELEGYICKAPVYRKTPLGKEVADILIAVNRPVRKSDYIPCIAWGDSAQYASFLEVGSKVHIWGRIQSREYTKKTDAGEEIKTVYEVSANKLDLCLNE